MTEQVWSTNIDFEQMLQLIDRNKDKRRLRLFGCGCCRCAWRIFVDSRSRQSIDVSELFADGMASDSDLKAAIEAASDCSDELEDKCLAGLPPDVLKIAEDNWNAAEMAWKATVGIYEVTELAQIGAGFSVDVPSLLRDIFGNPFRPIALDPRWRTSTVVDLAQAIYDERAFDRMPILADALMDAGCDSDEMILHCRGDGTHVRGCWVVDLILGKA